MYHSVSKILKIVYSERISFIESVISKILDKYECGIESICRDIKFATFEYFCHSQKNLILSRFLFHPASFLITASIEKKLMVSF